MDSKKYRRQYVIGPPETDCPFQCKSSEIDQHHVLFAHPDLTVTHVSRGEYYLWILGEIYDFRKPCSNEEIAGELVGLSLDDLLIKVGAYSGRFVLVLRIGVEVYLVHDATASRKVYYGQKDGRLWMASQAPLLARILEVEEAQDEERRAFYASPEYLRLSKSNPGNSTRFQGICQLMPNHYLRVSDSKSERFWPKEKLEFRDYRDVAQEAATLIRGYMVSILSRHKVMMPVTAGKDSRILLAASRGYQDSIFYYVNREPGMEDTHRDIRVPRALSKKLGFDFHVLELPHNEDIDTDFKQLYFENNPEASTYYLPHIFNYYKHYNDRINLPGNITSNAYGVFRSPYMHPSGKNFARLNKIQNFPFAVRNYDQWVQECREFPAKYNLNLVNLFYWEERMGNWGTQVQLDKDIAQEDINLFNSRDLSILLQSVHHKYIFPPDFQLHREIVKVLWPEALSIPINPGKKTRKMKFYQRTGLMNLLVYLKYSPLNGFD